MEFESIAIQWISELMKEKPIGLWNGKWVKWQWWRSDWWLSINGHTSPRWAAVMKDKAARNRSRVMMMQSLCPLTLSVEGWTVEVVKHCSLDLAKLKNVKEAIVFKYQFMGITHLLFGSNTRIARCKYSVVAKLKTRFRSRHLRFSRTCLLPRKS